MKVHIYWEVDNRKAGVCSRETEQAALSSRENAVTFTTPRGRIRRRARRAARAPGTFLERAGTSPRAPRASVIDRAIRSRGEGSERVDRYFYLIS